jgi:radical SAM protein with 4Fe4S-binding SPASM domain
VPQNYRKESVLNELKAKQIFSILDQLAEIGCFYLGFTGGEPFLRKDIMRILWYAKKRGFEVIIYTNGSLINEKVADELKRLRPNKVDITIPAISKDAFERISGLVGSRDKVFGAIDLLHKKGVNLGFKSCVLKENESQINQIQDFAASLNALHRLDDMLSPCLDGSKEPYKYRGSLKPVTRNQSTETRDKESDEYYFQTENREPKTGNLFKCGVGRNQVAITPLGELKMCLMIDYPKYRILRTSLGECWQRLKELVKNIKPDGDYRCDRCELKAYCKWCPAEGWLENRHFTSCVPESRANAERIKDSLHSQHSIV